MRSIRLGDSESSVNPGGRGLAVQKNLRIARAQAAHADFSPSASGIAAVDSDAGQAFEYIGQRGVAGFDDLLLGHDDLGGSVKAARVVPVCAGADFHGGQGVLRLGRRCGRARIGARLSPCQSTDQQ